MMMLTSEPQDVMAAALEYAGQGYPVFPCNSDKEPIVKHGFLDASVDPDLIRAWWSRHPTANVAMATGATSGRVVVDYDPEKGALASINELPPSPPTYTVATGGGHRGLQKYYLYPEGGIGCSVGKVAPGVDVRGDAGYVIVPPSKTTLQYTAISTNPLAPLPAWVLRRLERPSSLHSDAEDGGGEPVSVDGPPIEHGKRNTTLFRIGCRLRALGYGHAAIRATLESVNQRRCEPPIGSLREDKPGEVAKIAAELCKRYAPGSASGGATNEALEHLATLENLLWYRRWQPSQRKIFKTLLGNGERHGQVTYLRDGTLTVAGSISHREIAERTGLSRDTVSRQLHQLKRTGIVTAGSRSTTTEPGTLLLPVRSPRAGSVTKSGQSLHSAVPEGGLTNGAIGTVLCRYSGGLRRSVPGLKRLGPGGEEMIDALLRCGGTAAVNTLGEMLGKNRPRSIKRKDGPLRRLEVERVVVIEGDVVKLSADWQEQLEQTRAATFEDEHGEIQRTAHVLDRAIRDYGATSEEARTAREAHEAARRTFRRLRGGA